MSLAWILFMSVCVAATPYNPLKVAGKVCRHFDDAVWTCVLETECPTNLRVSNNTECKSTGSDPFVCCRPERDDLPAGVKSAEWCEEYGKHVFETVYDPYIEEFFQRDRCLSVQILGPYKSPVEPREYPHMAYIGGGQEVITWFCGGSLISERFILSSAKCVKYGSKRANWARLGDYDAESQQDDDYGLGNSVTLRIERQYVHMDYNSSELYGIALFKLEVKVDFSEYIRPACLYTEDRLPGSYGIATGWGWGLDESRGETSEIMQKSNITIVPCESHAANPADNETSICGVGLFDPNLCKGDIGGPLQWRLTKPYCMYGLMAVLSHCEVQEHSTRLVYTRVSRYTKWIESIVWPFL